MLIISKFKLYFRYFILDVLFSKQYLNSLAKRESLDKKNLARVQSSLLLKSLIAAKKKIKVYKNIKLPVSDINIQNYISSHYPVISKHNLLERRSDFYPNNGKAKPLQITGKSSGTTGTPLELFRSYDSILWENAFIKRHWKNICGKKNFKRATLRGDLVENPKANQYWLFNEIDNQLILSSKDLNDKTCQYFVDILNEFKPDFLQAYPSTAFQLAQYVESKKFKLKIPFIFTSSEMLYPYQREIIEKNIGQVCDLYGMAERVALATECIYKNLHVNSDYSYVEILDDNNNPTDEEGYVVGTTLHNYCMPLIRYKLSDRTKWKKGECECGSHYPMIEPISGKFEDTIYDISGTPVSPSLITFAFKGVNNIEKAQVAQIATDKWLIRLVPEKNYVASDGNLIVKNLHNYVSSKLNIEVVVVDDIARTSSGKFRWVLNEIKKAERSER